MKKILFVITALLISVGVFGQVGNLLKPIDNVLKVSDVRGIKSLTNEYALRLNVGVTATQSTYNKETKTFETNPLTAVGFGLGYQHYVAQTDGTLFNNFGANLLLLVPTGTGNNGVGVGLFGNVSIFQVGVDYNFMLKKVSLDTGVTLKF